MIDSFPLRPGPLPESPGVMGGWRITSTFGSRPNPLTGRPGNHRGMDLAYGGCQGEPILAPCRGRVAQSWDPGGGGNWTAIHGVDGCYWGLGHAARFEPAVHGRTVNAGTVVAYVGTTGGSTGPHLHLAYKGPGSTTYTDPYDLANWACHRGFPTEGTAMATDDLNRTIAQQIDIALRSMVPLLRDFRDYQVITDARPQAGGPIAWILSGLDKAWVPTPALHDLLKDAATKGQAINDLGWQTHGSPWIALLDAAQIVGPAPP